MSIIPAATPANTACILPILLPPTALNLPPPTAAPLIPPPTGPPTSNFSRASPPSLKLLVNLSMIRSMASFCVIISPSVVFAISISASISSGFK